MRKMPCLLVREFNGPNSFTLTDQITTGCEWVLKGEGIASRKWDGTACIVINGELFKRFDAKRKPDGSYKLPPNGAIPCCDPDPITGHHPHWIKCLPNHPPDQYHIQAWQKLGQAIARTKQDGRRFVSPPDGTYELIGPQIGANAEGVEQLMFKLHGADILEVPRTLEGIRKFISDNMMEGVVFSNKNGLMCKIRRKDFGLPWGKNK